MRVVFRADASPQIGAGHVMRCLTLANALGEGGATCTFLCREHLGHLGQKIEGAGHQLHLLPISESGYSAGAGDPEHAEWLGVSWEVDATQTLEALADESIDWLVVDHYALDARWEARVRTASRNVMVIDDLADRPHDCDLLLDQNLGRVLTDYLGRVPSGCLILIGPKFALLRSEFSRLREYSLLRRQNSELKRILVSMGGFDQVNATSEALRAIENADLSSEVRVDVVMGADSPSLGAVREQVLDSKMHSTISVDVSDMAIRMAECDFAIGAAGSTSWERCALGVPCALVVLAENQQLLAKTLDSVGAAILVERTHAFVEKLKEAIVRLSTPEERESFSLAARSVADGLGIPRVIAAMGGMP